MVGTFLDLGRFEAWGVLHLGRFTVGTFRGTGRFVAEKFWSWNILQLGVGVPNNQLTASPPPDGRALTFQASPSHDSQAFI